MEVVYGEHFIRNLLLQCTFLKNFFDKLVGKFFCSLTSEVIRSSYGEHRRCYIVEPKLAKLTNQTNYASRSY